MSQPAPSPDSIQELLAYARQASVVTRYFHVRCSLLGELALEAQQRIWDQDLVTDKQLMALFGLTRDELVSREQLKAAILTHFEKAGERAHGEPGAETFYISVTDLHYKGAEAIRLTLMERGAQLLFAGGRELAESLYGPLPETLRGKWGKRRQYEEVVTEEWLTRTLRHRARATPQEMNKLIAERLRYKPSGRSSGGGFGSGGSGGDSVSALALAGSY